MTETFYCITSFVITMLIFIIVLFPIKSRAKSFYDCKNLSEIIQLIDYGNLRPFYTGMSIGKVKKAISQITIDKNDFEESIEAYRILGCIYPISLPIPKHQNIESLSAYLDKDKKIASLMLQVDNGILLEVCKLLVKKFGLPQSCDKQFIIWKKKNKSINIFLEECTISIMDDSLFMNRF